MPNRVEVPDFDPNKPLWLAVSTDQIQPVADCLARKDFVEARQLLIELVGQAVALDEAVVREAKRAQAA